MKRGKPIILIHAGSSASGSTYKHYTTEEAAIYLLGRDIDKEAIMVAYDVMDLPSEVGELQRDLEAEVEKLRVCDDYCKHCGNDQCTFHNPICEASMDEHIRARRNGMPSSGRKA